MFGRLGIGVLPVLSHFTGYLRIAADEHNFTDMTSGAVKGEPCLAISSPTGFRVPQFN